MRNICFFLALTATSTSATASTCTELVSEVLAPATRGWFELTAFFEEAGVKRPAGLDALAEAWTTDANPNAFRMKLSDGKLGDTGTSSLNPHILSFTAREPDARGRCTARFGRDEGGWRSAFRQLEVFREGDTVVFRDAVAGPTVWNRTTYPGDHHLRFELTQISEGAIDTGRRVRRPLTGREVPDSTADEILACAPSDDVSTWCEGEVLGGMDSWGGIMLRYSYTVKPCLNSDDKLVVVSKDVEDGLRGVKGGVHVVKPLFNDPRYWPARGWRDQHDCKDRRIYYIENDERDGSMICRLQGYKGLGSGFSGLRYDDCDLMNPEDPQ